MSGNEGRGWYGECPQAERDPTAHEIAEWWTKVLSKPIPAPPPTYILPSEEFRYRSWRLGGEPDSPFYRAATPGHR